MPRRRFILKENYSNKKIIKYKRDNFSKMQITRSWREQKVMLKQRFPILSDQDFIIVDDCREDMMTKLATKLKLSRLQLTALFAELQTY